LIGMRVSLYLLVLVLGVVSVHASGDHTLGHRLNQYSFKAPFDAEASDPLPGWTSIRSTLIDRDYVRLTSDKRNERGLLSGSEPFTSQTVELTLEFHIHSPSSTGADGMVLWMTDKPIAPGTTFGGPARWNGVAVIMDTYDNNGEDPHPFIMLHYNDGYKDFEFAHDGASTYLGGCYADYRNQDRSFLHLFIEKGQISLLVDETGEGNWKVCAGPIAVTMPEEYYFGLSAATGGYSDFHDVLAFSVNSMESRALEIIRPPDELLEQSKGARKGAAKPTYDPNCLLEAECVNVDRMQEPIASLNNLRDTIGHQLNKIQQSLTQSTDELSNALSPASQEIHNRRQSVQMLRSDFDEQLKRLQELRDSLSRASQGSKQSDRTDTRMAENLKNAETTLKKIQNELRGMGGLVDIQLFALDSRSGTSWSTIALLVVSVLLLLISIISTVKSGRERPAFPY